MKRIFKFLGVLLLAGTFIWTLYFLYAKSEKPLVEYKTEKVTRNTIIRKTVATGSVIPRREVFIKPQVSGIIDELYIEAGKMIKKGDPEYDQPERSREPCEPCKDQL
jgi:HlyD family secretion protein